MTDDRNMIIGGIMTVLFILASFYLIGVYYFKSSKEHGFPRNIVPVTIYALLVLVVSFLFLWLPNWLDVFFSRILNLDQWIRWGFILAIGSIYFARKKNAEGRGIFSFLTVYAILLAGWLFNKWIGIIAISFPILTALLFAVYYIALAILPASDPANPREKFYRFAAFLAYLWGHQQSFWKSPAPISSTKEPEKRIDSTQTFKFLQGIGWTYPHQAAGILSGATFDVRGPGLFFFNKSEQPFELIDLRVQNKKSTIKAISREGIPFEADVSVSFCIDNETWTREQYHAHLRANIIQGREPDTNLDGIFPFSKARVKAALSFRSKRILENGEEAVMYWDDRILAMAEEAAREALSERSIDELWRARVLAGGSAADEIATEMRAQLDLRLRRMGIRLLNARAGFKDKDSPKIDEIAQQQISAWTVEWERKHAMMIADGRVEAERVQQEARAYAHSVLLTAIADGLRQARALHENLPRYVIAMRFISVLEKLVEEQSGENEKTSQPDGKITSKKSHLLTQDGE